MKKYILILGVLLSLFADAQTYRYRRVPEDGGPYLVPNKAIFAITYSTTIALAPKHEQIKYDFAQLTGAMSISIVSTSSKKTDIIQMFFSSDGTNRIVTFGTGFTSNGTLTVLASSSASISFEYNGTKWIEIARQNLNSQTSPLRTNTTYTASGTVAASELAGGLLTVTTGTVTLTLPTATQVATQIGAVAGTTFDFVVVNTGSIGPATVAVGAGIVASGFPGTNTLTVPLSTTIGIAVFRLTFISGTAATLTRTS